MPKSVIIFLAIILSIINIIGVYFFDVSNTRYFKLASSIILFISFLKLKGFKNKFIFSAFIAFVLSDILMFRYEQLLFSKLTLIILLVAYIFISLDILPKLKSLKLKWYVLLIFIGVVAINVYMFFELISLMQIETKDFYQKIIIYIYGISIVLMAVIGGIYNFRFNSMKSATCILFIFFFILSTVSNAIAYYSGVSFLFYFNRVFYVLGLSLMTYYAVNDFKKETLFLDEY